MKLRMDWIPTMAMVFLFVWGVIVSEYAIYQSSQVDELKNENDHLNQLLWDMEIIQNNLGYENELYEGIIEDIWDYQRENPPIDVGLFIWAIENTENETLINLLSHIIANIKPNTIQVPVEAPKIDMGVEP